MQLAHYFSDDVLSRDVFLRWHMDGEGYVPAALVFNFPSLRALGLSYGELLDAAGSHAVLELDRVNETVRLAAGGAPWDRWLFPNGDGTAGVARWLKVPEETAAVLEGTTVPPPAVAAALPLTLEQDFPGLSLGEKGSPPEKMAQDVPSLVASSDCADSLSLQSM